jgi:Mg2+ and Co2+ transporter CorA
MGANPASFPGSKIGITDILPEGRAERAEPPLPTSSPYMRPKSPLLYLVADNIVVSNFPIIDLISDDLEWIEDSVLSRRISEKTTSFASTSRSTTMLACCVTIPSVMVLWFRRSGWL